jgi:hypothetical protein
MPHPGNNWAPERLRELARRAERADCLNTAAALRDFAAVMALLGRVSPGVELDVWVDADGVSVAKLDYEPPRTGDTPLAALLALAEALETGAGQ